MPRFSIRSRFLLRAASAAAVLILFAGSAFAQLPRTKLFALSPTGAKAGTTVEVRITSGDDLEEIDALVFNHSGIKAVQKTQESKGEQQPVANTFVVTVGGDVPAGLYEVRASGLYGMSNPRTFVVGQREEIEEKEGNNERDQANEIEPGQTAGGVINGATDIDWFKFPGKQGQRVIVTCRAARIDSKLDGVLEMYSGSGRRLAFARLEIRDDPFLDVTLPADGEYYLKVYDFVYGGGADYFYRLTLHDGPHIDYILPPAGPPGSTQEYTLYGRNLPGGEPAGVLVRGRPLEKLAVKITLPEEPATLDSVDYLAPYESNVDGVSYVLDSPQGASNPKLIHFSTSPVALEEEPNDEPAQATKFSAPGEIAGQFQKRGDVDYVAFEAKKGEEYFVEVFGQRHGTTADPYFVLEQVTKSKDGKENVRRITSQDDEDTNLAQNVFDTASDDPVYRFRVPEDATYRVAVRDRYFASRGDPRLIWRLAVRRPQPDFRLVVLPETPPRGNNQPSTTGSLALRRGENLAVRVMAFRRDGFDGTIDVAAEGLPQGVTCRGAAIGAGQNSAQLIFTADENAAKWSGLIEIVGRTRIEDDARAKALEAARQAVQPAREALGKLEENAKKAQQAFQKAEEEHNEAREAASKKPDDKDLAKRAEDLKKQLDAARSALDKANAELQAGKQRLADAEAAVKNAEDEHKAAVREIVHSGRPATIVWSPPNNQTPGESRLARTVGLSVIEEPAPLQIVAEAGRVEANQGRQILVPVKLAKREGFIDNNVNLQFDGLPRNSNIQVQNKPINKGKDGELYRLFVRNNARPGAYTVYLRTQVQVNHRRNPQKAERLKKKLEEANERLKAAQEELKNVSAQRDARAKELAEAQQKLKQAQQAATTADKKVQELTEKVKEAEAAATDDEKKEQLEQARQKLQKAQEEAAAAQKTVEEAQAAANSTEAERKKLEEQFKTADAKVKEVQARQKAVEKEAKAAEDAAKPKKINVFPVSTPIVIEVKPAPAALSASVPGGGNLKKGQKLDVKVTVRRQNGFAGPVTLTLPLPPDVKGVSAEPVTIPAEENEGVLSIQAAGDATEGQLQNMVIRGAMDFNGRAAVDAPINLKVSK